MVAAAEQAPAAAAAPASAPTAAPAGDAERPARKRRRRRRGQRVEGAESAPRNQQADAKTGGKPGAASGANGDAPRQRRPTQQKPARRAEPTPTESPSLLSRIGRGLKSLVTRAPRSNH